MLGCLILFCIKVAFSVKASLELQTIAWSPEPGTLVLLLSSTKQWPAPPRHFQTGCCRATWAKPATACGAACRSSFVHAAAKTWCVEQPPFLGTAGRQCLLTRPWRAPGRLCQSSCVRGTHQGAQPHTSHEACAHIRQRARARETGKGRRRGTGATRRPWLRATPSAQGRRLAPEMRQRSRER